MKRNLYVMYAIAFFQGMVFYAPIATLYRLVQGISVFQITVIESISLAVFIVLEVPWGAVADRIGYRTTMVFCSCLYFVSKLVFWKASDFSGFLLERLMLSVVLSGLSGVDSSIIYLSCKGKNSQHAFGMYNGMGMAGLVTAAVLYALVIQDNYPLAGFLTAISYGAAALLSFGITEVKHPNAGKSNRTDFIQTVEETLKDSRLLLFLIAAAFLSETHQTITVFLNQLQYERCGLRSSTIGLVYIIAATAGMSDTLSSGVTGRMGINRSFLLFCGLPAVSCLVLALTQNGFFSVLAVLTLRVSDTLFQPFQTELQNRRIKTAHRATALSINSMIMNCVAVGTNLVFGALSDRWLPSAFFFGGGISILCLCFFFLMRKKTTGRM